MLDYLTREATKAHLTAARMAILLREAKSTNAVAFMEEVLDLLYDAKTKAAQTAGGRYRKPHQKEMNRAGFVGG